MSGKPWYTLTEAARLLDEPQHRLIYFVEKGVVSPEVQESAGRGSSRRFSRRNLLDFAIALRLRDALIPAEATGAVIRLLHAFETHVAKDMPGFALPDGLAAERSPDLRIVLSDGERLFASLAQPGKAPALFGGVELGRLTGDGPLPAARLRQLVARARPEKGGSSSARDFAGRDGSRFARLELNVTQIARDLVGALAGS